MKSNLKRVGAVLSVFAICLCAFNTVAYSFNMDSPVNRDDIKRFKS